MSQAHPQIPRPARLAAVVAALAAGALLGGCGGESDSGRDPQQVLEATFSGGEPIETGVADLTLSVEAEGGENPGSLDVRLGGPFDFTGDGIGQFDLDIEIDAETGQDDVDFSAGVVSTGDSGFVRYEETAYALPQELFDRFVTTFTQLRERESAGDGRNPLSALGISPTRWLTDLSDEGTEEVGDVETVHVRGEADIPKLVQDLKRIARQAGEAVGGAQEASLNQLNEIVRSATVDVYSGSEDDRLRRLDAQLELSPPEGTPGAPSAVRVDLSLVFTELDEPQQVDAPSSSRPLSQLLSRFGVDAGSLGGALGAGTGAGGGAGQPGGDPGGAGPDSAQSYYECLNQAGPAEEVQACAELLE